MDYPLSILIPTYNRRTLLEEALSSILRERLSKEVEIVVVDDGSEDDTWDFLCFLKNKYPNLKIKRHDKNLGVSAARNTALGASKGLYVMFLDSDDYLVEGALEKIFKKIKEGKEVYLVTTYVEKKGKKRKKVFPKPPLDPIQRLKYFIDGCYAEALYVIKRTLFSNFHFNPHLKVREDWVFKGKLFALSPPEIIEEPLAVVRDHPFRSRYIPQFYEESVLLSVEELFQSLPETFQGLYPYAKAKALIELSTKYIGVKNYNQAYFYLNQARQCYPSILFNFKFFKKWLKCYFLRMFS